MALRDEENKETTSSPSAVQVADSVDDGGIVDVVPSAQPTGKVADALRNNLSASSVVVVKNDEQLQEVLSCYSVGEVTELIEKIIADKSVNRVVRRDAVGRVVDNQPHPVREFEKFKKWNGEIRRATGSNEYTVFGVNITALAPFIATSLGGLFVLLGDWSVFEAVKFGVIAFLFSAIITIEIFAMETIFLRRYQHERHNLTLGEFKEQERRKQLEEATQQYESYQEKMRLLGLSEEGGSTVSVADVKKDFADARDRIASYELDMEKALSRPAFNDVTVSEVSDMVLQLKKCRRMVNEISVSTASDVASAVDELWVKINAAELTAKRIAWSEVSDEEQKNLRIALDLVKQANDPGNPDELRRNLYARLKKVVARLDAGGVTIPAKMTEQIERRASPELTELSSHSGSSMDSVPTPASR